MTNKTKILYIITKSGWGGAQRYTYDLATNLPRERFDIVVAAGGSGELAVRLATAGIRTIAVPEFQRDVAIGRELVALWRLTRICIAERPDVIHCSSSKAGGIGAVAAFCYKIFTVNFKPFTVFTVHGWPFREARPVWQRALIAFFSWLSTIFQDRVVVIDTADYRAARWFVPDAKLALIRHGIARPDFLSRAEARARLGQCIGAPVELNTLIIGTIAELTKNKGLVTLIAAAQRLSQSTPSRSWRIIIIGNGEDRAALEEAATRHGLADLVSFAGFIAAANRLLAGLDIFVLPSWKEGLPYAIMEAMAAGLPIVASRAGGIPDLIQENVSGILVKPADDNGLARALVAVINDAPRRATLGRTAERALGEHFSLDVMLEATMAVYSRRPPVARLAPLP